MAIWLVALLLDETRFLPELVSPVSAPADMAICSSIASAMIALTGIVFSLTFVMVQFSATAYRNQFPRNTRPRMGPEVSRTR